MSITYQTAIHTDQIETVEFSADHHRVHIPVWVASTNSRSKKTFEYTIHVTVELVDRVEKPYTTVYNAQGNMVHAAKFNHLRDAALETVNAEMDVQLVRNQKMDLETVNTLREKVGLARI